MKYDTIAEQTFTAPIGYVSYCTLSDSTTVLRYPFQKEFKQTCKYYSLRNVMKILFLHLP